MVLYLCIGNSIIIILARNPDRETIFRFKQFEVRNSFSAMKVGTDGVLLGAWFDVPPGASVLDVGTGCGVIGLMAAQRGAAQVVEVEIDAGAASEAIVNAESSPWSDRVSVVHCDFMTYEPGCLFDRIVSNPPFFNEAVVSPDSSRAMARHEGSLSLHSLLSRAAGMLAPEGRVALIAPMSRYSDVAYAASLARLSLVRMSRVFTARDPMRPPSRVLCEYSLGASSAKYDDIHMFSDEYRQLVAPFYLDKTK